MSADDQWAADPVEMEAQLSPPSGLDPEQVAALARHGYPDLRCRGVSGRPDEVIEGYTGEYPHGTAERIRLRNRVCHLDGIEIDGHEPSDLDPFGQCIHCGAELFPNDDEESER